MVFQQFVTLYCKYIIKVLILLSFLIPGSVQAEKKYSPSDVFAAVEFSNQIIDHILQSKNITDYKIPQSRETAAKPMHVYELHVSILSELHHYAVNANRRPPPLAISSPIKYTPTDVYYLTQLIIKNLQDLYEDEGGVMDFSMKNYSGKSPSNVYSELFELFYKVNRLNGKEKVSPSVVYAHIYRAIEDLQLSLLIMSKRLDKNQQDKKRLLLTATYGMHPDGTALPSMEESKTPGDVLEQALEIRGKLNILRKHNKLAEIKIPQINQFGKVKPIDVFLQTQFIIAELNLLKIPMLINSTTNRAKRVEGKSPSDVYQQMKHMNYMLNRLVSTL